MTDGTATAPGDAGSGAGDVAGLTGVGPVNSWFVGHRGDLAFAVLVVDGGSVGPAVVVAQRLLASSG